MPTFIYTAANKMGGTVKGKLTAPNEMELEERLEEMELVVIDFKIQQKRKGSIFGKVQNRDLIMFCVHLEQLDRAGVPLLDALADLRDSSDSAMFKDIMADVYENVKTGDMLSQALGKHKEVFDEVFCGLVQAGEKTGQMTEAFGQLANHLKWNEEFRRSIKKAIRYPIALLVVMGIVITLMMTQVVPDLVDFLTSQGFDLPIHTRALIAVSDFFMSYWYVVIFGPIIFIMSLITMYKKSTKMRYKFDAAFLNVPFIGPVILKINLARFSHFFAITFSSGIGILECLETARKVVGNLIIRDSVTAIIKHVSEGSSITRAISTTEQFPSLVIRMFRVGEESGNMDEALENINFFYDREVEDSVQTLIGVIQPVLTVVMGVIMFWVIAAVFGPLYDSFSQIDF